MSRSCQRATFSSPTCAAARTTRARPQIRSAVIGFRLCGIADEPFWPAAERLLDLAHLRPREVADLERERVERRGDRRRASESSCACRSRWMICVEWGAGSRPSRSHASRSSSGPVAAYVPTAPDSLPTRISSSADSSRSRSRSSSNAQPASFSPKVVGSAWTPCVRPDDERLRGAPLRASTTASNAARDAVEEERARLADLQRERRVEHVGGRQPVVEPPSPFGVQPFADCVDERGEIVARPALDLATCSGEGGAASRADRRCRLCGNDPELGPGVERRELDVEPQLELALLRPDPGHGRP